MATTRNRIGRGGEDEGNGDEGEEKKRTGREERLQGWGRE